MLKKFLSLLGVVGILSTMIVSTAFAADNDTLISSLTVSKSSLVSGKSIIDAKFQITADATVTAQIVDKTTPETVLKTLTLPASCSTACPLNTDIAITWDGKKTDETDAAPKDYTLRVSAAATGTTDTDSDELTVTVLPALTVNTFTTSYTNSPSTWDPTLGDMTFSYTLSKSAQATLYIIDSYSNEVTNFYKGVAASGSSTWNGKVSNMYIAPKTYTAKLEATTATPIPEIIASTKTFTVAYSDADAPQITNLDASPTSFVAEDESTTFSFDLDSTARVVAKILDSNNDVVLIPDDFDGTTEYDNGALSFDWDGTQTDGDYVLTGNYKVEVTASNDLGASYEVSSTVSVTSQGSQYLDGSSKIKSISFDPSSSWDPTDDGDLSIEWTTDTNEADFDNFKIIAKRAGETNVEVYNEDDLSDDDYSVDFSGKDDDDEYLSNGKWQFVFVGELNGKEYAVTDKYLTVTYQKPTIDDSFITKMKIDPENYDEGTYLVFQLNDDAKVDVDVLRGSTKKVSLIEDEELSKDVWYAVYWDGKDEDGDNFKYSDSFKIQLTAKSVGDDDVASTASETIDLVDDTVSSNKSNITEDIAVSPAIEQGGKTSISFNIDSDAKLKVGIYEGTSTSGSPDVELLPFTEKTSDDYTFNWNGRDKNNKILKKGFYAYKITTSTGSGTDETETGVLVVGSVGEVFGGPSADTGTSTGGTGTYESCGFLDVESSNSHCTAIKWAADRGIFKGDPDGSFRPYDTINRAEALTVVLKAFGLPLYGDDGTDLGWNDVIKGGWYMSFLRSGKLLGLISGDQGTGTVRPDAGVSRVELLRFVYQGRKTPVTVCKVNPYSDVLLGQWYTNYVCQAKVDSLFDIFAGYFMPGEMATRGEMAEVLYKLSSK